MVTGVFEVVGGLEALAQLTLLSYEIGKRLWRCKKALTHAKAKISRIYNVVRDFELILEIFYQVEQEATISGCGLSGGRKCSLLMERLSDTCEQDFGNIERILDSVRPLRADKGYSKFHRWKALANWQLHREDVDRLLVSLHSSKLSLDMVLHLVYIRQLVKTIRDLQLAGAEVSLELKEKLARRRKKIKDLEAECREAKQECARLRLLANHPEQDIACLVFLDVVQQLVTQEVKEVVRCQTTLRQNPPTVVSPLPPSQPFPTPTVNVVQRQNPESSADNHQTSALSSFETVSRPTNSIASTPSSRSCAPQSTGNLALAVAPPNKAPGAYVPTIGLPIPQQRPQNPRPPSPETEIGYVVVDDNDGRGPRTELRRPRKPRF